MGRAIVVRGPFLQPRSRTSRMWQPAIVLADQPKSRVNRDEWERQKAKAERRAAWIESQKALEREKAREERAKPAEAPAVKPVEAAQAIAVAPVQSTKVRKKFYTTKRQARGED